MFNRPKTWQDCSMNKNKRLQDEYQFPGYRTKATTKGIFGDSHTVVIKLERRQKKQNAGAAGQRTALFMTEMRNRYGTCPAEISGCCWSLRFGGFSVRSVVK